MDKLSRSRSGKNHTTLGLRAVVVFSFVLGSPTVWADSFPTQQIPPSGTYTSPKKDKIAVDLGPGRDGFVRVCLAMAGNINFMKAVEVRIPRNTSGSLTRTIGRIETRKDYRGWNCLELNATQMVSGTAIVLSQTSLTGDNDTVGFSYSAKLNGKSLNLHWNED